MTGYARSCVEKRKALIVWAAMLQQVGHGP
jgi:hypothetical protein